MDILKSGVHFLLKSLYYGFFGISLEFYVVNLFWGLLPFILLTLIIGLDKMVLDINPTTILFALLILLYPYARCGYAVITDALMGDKVFFLALPALIIWYFIRLFIIWMAAPVLIPIALIYLVRHQFKLEKESMNQRSTIE